MMATRSCPDCGATTRQEGMDPPACSGCGKVFPDRSGEAGEKGEDGRPALLMFLMIFLFFFALFGGMISFITFMMPGSDDYLVDNQLATKNEFLLNMLPSMLRFLSAGPIAYGLWKERIWARPLLIAFVGIYELGKFLLPGWREAPAEVIVPRFILSGVIVGLLAWYLYKKQNVVRYYQTLSTQKPSISTQNR
jgi:hypothetical protein